MATDAPNTGARLRASLNPIQVTTAEQAAPKVRTGDYQPLKHGRAVWP